MKNSPMTKTTKQISPALLLLPWIYQDLLDFDYFLPCFSLRARISSNALICDSSRSSQTPFSIFPSGWRSQFTDFNRLSLCIQIFHIRDFSRGLVARNSWFLVCRFPSSYIRRLSCSPRTGIRFQILVV